METRLKALRKELHLTQQALADKLNVSKSTIEALEYGRREITDRMIKDICREFSINEIWLRTGEGEMFKQYEFSNELSDMVADMYHSPDSLKTRLIMLLNQMDDEMFEKYYEFCKAWVEATKDKED